MVNRNDISRRAREKSLQRLTEEKKNNPEKFEHIIDERGEYLCLEWDYKHKQINDGKIPRLKELRERYGGKK